MSLQGVSLCFSARSGDDEMRFLDDIEANYPPEEWPTQMLKQRGLDWAVELLNEATPERLSA